MVKISFETPARTPGLLGRGARLVDEAEVGLDERRDASHPAAGMGVWSARASSLRRGGVVEACCQRPAIHSSMLRYQRTDTRVPSSPRATAFASSSSKIARGRSISPRRIMRRASE